MKKLFFAVAAMLVSASISAQVWVGGSLGLDSKSYPQEGRKTNTQFTLSPVAGYALSDAFEVGLSAIVGLSVNEGGVDGVKSTKWGLYPFARYYFLGEEKVNLFLEGGVAFSQTKVGDADAKSLLKVGIMPGIKIPLNENLAIVSKFGWLGFSKNPDDSKAVALSLSSALSFGLYYAF